MKNTDVKLQNVMFQQNRNHSLYEQAKSYAFEYIDGLQNRGVFPTDDAVSRLEVFDEPIPDRPGDPEIILRLLHENGSPASVAQTGGRYFGFVNGAVIPAALAAKWLVDVWDQNAAVFLTSPITSHLETVCERWLTQLLGLPPDTASGFVSGSSTATLCGLAAGRNELLRRRGWDVNSDGLFGAPPIRVIVSEQAHATVFKALSILGLGRTRVELVPADMNGRMLSARLPTLDHTCLVIAQAGHVATGAFDPLYEIAERSRRAAAWFHIDGAFGLWAAASRNKRYLTCGMAAADSWSVDGHKTLNSPYDCGIVLCKERSALTSAMQASGSYIQYSDRRDGMHYTPEMSRRSRAVELWATLKALGQTGIEELVDRLCSHAQYFSELLHQNGFRVINDVVFNQVLVACDSSEQTKDTLSNLQKSGECWCGSTQWQGHLAIRISVCSWATTIADIERSAAAFVHARHQAVTNRAVKSSPASATF